MCWGRIKINMFFSLRNILLQFFAGAMDCSIYFLFEKQAFNGLLKVIGIQKQFHTNIICIVHDISFYRVR